MQNIESDNLIKTELPKGLRWGSYNQDCLGANLALPVDNEPIRINEELLVSMTDTNPIEEKNDE
jgi:hypothetical protein